MENEMWCIFCATNYCSAVKDATCPCREPGLRHVFSNRRPKKCFQMSHEQKDSADIRESSERISALIAEAKPMASDNNWREFVAELAKDSAEGVGFDELTVASDPTNVAVAHCFVCKTTIWSKQERIDNGEGWAHPICLVTRRAKTAEQKLAESLTREAALEAALVAKPKYACAWCKYVPKGDAATIWEEMQKHLTLCEVRWNGNKAVEYFRGLANEQRQRAESAERELAELRASLTPSQPEKQL